MEKRKNSSTEETQKLHIIKGLHKNLQVDWLEL